MLAPLVIASLLGQPSMASPELGGPVRLYDSDGTRAAEFIDLRSALEAAHPGATLVLEPGVYSGDGNTDLAIDRDVRVRGRLRAGDTVIDCRGRGRAFSIEGGSAAFESLTIRNGVARSGGGGVQVAGGSASFRDVAFEHNRGASGGAVNVGSEAFFSGCVFQGNAATSLGGAVMVNVRSEVFGCRFEGNHSGLTGGALALIGDVARVELSSFIGNSSTVGGAISVGLVGTLLVDRCHFLENQAEQGGAVNAGGSALVFATLQNSLFARNFAVSAGGLRLSCPALVQNCTVVENEAYNTAAAGIQTRGNNALIVNSILWGNLSLAAPELRQLSSIPSIFTPAGVAEAFACDIQDTLDLVNNIDADPLFGDQGAGEYRLSSGSPCIDAGIAFPVTASQLDLDNEPRLQGRSVDIGADERPGRQHSVAR